MSENKMKKFAFGVIFLALISSTIIGFDNKNISDNFSRIYYLPKKDLSVQEYEKVISVIQQRIEDKHINGKVNYKTDKIILEIADKDLTEEILVELIREGHLIITDESGIILFDNRNGNFIESTEILIEKDINGIDSYAVSVQFKEEYVLKLEEIMKKNAKKHLAVIVDGEIYAMPVIQEKSEDGSLIMNQFETKQQAQMMVEIWGMQILPCELEWVDDNE